MRHPSPYFDRLLDFCRRTPIIDTHDHTTVCEPAYTDAIAAIMAGYFHSDIWSVSSDAQAEYLLDTSIPLESRWPTFERMWQLTKHTGYAQVSRRVLSHFYGIDELNLPALLKMQENLLDLRDPLLFEKILDDAGIVLRLEHMALDVGAMQAGTQQLPPRSRPVIALIDYHKLTCAGDIHNIAGRLGKPAGSLGEYLEICREIFQIHKDFGAVAFKDECAYDRSLSFSSPSCQEAEAIFDWLIANPENILPYPDGIKALEDYLFHQFMDMAAALDLPVQLHTGHMAGIRNEITKANAVLLTPVLQAHPDTRFDLFHANWPYNGEILFLVKNYPNVNLNFCWVNIIDPVYSQQLYMQALSAVPHGKIHTHGSDYFGSADRAWAHAQITRENISCALSEMVEREFLDIRAAEQVAEDWLFHNPNRFYQTGLPYRPLA